MELGRILYFNHDNPHPSGGVQTIYAHVAHLNRNGFPAFVVHHSPGFRPAWFAEKVPTLHYGAGIQISSTDVVVVPEDMPILDHLKNVNVRKIVFCQNHFYAFNALPPGATWRSLGVSHVLSCSDVIADFLQTNLGWANVPVVHCAIDQQLFKPGAKKLQIAYMPRKSAIDASFVRGFFTALGGPTAQVNWIEISGLPQDRVAAILAESAIFLSLSHLEGLGLPPIEAMASGCAVVGYHGYGGLEYATHDNGFWCEEGNPVACANMLRSVVEMILRNDPKVRNVIEQGMQTAARYTAQRQEAEIVQFMKSVLSGPLPPVLMS